jgi:uncharacterized membrane protein
MFNSPAGILVLLAIACAVAAMFPQLPEKYLAPVAVIFLAVAVMLAGGK